MIFTIFRRIFTIFMNSMKSRKQLRMISIMILKKSRKQLRMISIMILKKSR